MNKDLGNLIKKGREEKNLTQGALAEKIGVTTGTISLYESGNRKPELDKIKKLSEQLNITEVELLGIIVPEADLNIALRKDEDLTSEDIDQIKKYIQSLKYVSKNKK